MNGISVACLLVGVLGHLPPVIGVTGPAALQRLYGIEFTEPNLRLLMQHRAILFGIVAAILLLAVFKADLRVFAMLVGLVSTVAFVALSWSMDGLNPLIARVVKVDWVIIAALLAGLVNETLLPRSVA
jgi:hypothetical protein